MKTIMTKAAFLLLTKRLAMIELTKNFPTLFENLSHQLIPKLLLLSISVESCPLKCTRNFTLSCAFHHVLLNHAQYRVNISVWLRSSIILITREFVDSKISFQNISSFPSFDKSKYVANFKLINVSFNQLFSAMSGSSTLSSVRSMRLIIFLI